MRVLTVGNLYPPHHFGGYELIWHSAVEYLRAAGDEVRVLTTDFRHSRAGPRDDDPGVFRELGWYWEDGEFPHRSWRERLALERANAAVLDRHLDGLRPDVVSWWPMGGMSLGLIARARGRGIPDVGVVGDEWLSYGPHVDAWTRLMSRRELRPLRPALEWATGLPTRFDPSPTHWIFISEAVRRAARSLYELPSTEVTHPGIDPARFAPAVPREWAWRLLYMGRIDERKGIATALEALPLLPPEAKLTIDGPGDEGFLARLHERAGAMGLAERVTFSNSSRDELPGLVAGADALLFPVQWEEPWGLVPLEAMAVGTPVVATGTGGSGEYLRHEHNCLIFDREAGPRGLAAALERLAADDGLRARLREHGHDTAASITELAFNVAVRAALERATR